MFVSLEKLATTPNFRPTKTLNAPTTKPTLPNQVLTRLGLKTNNEGTGGRASQGPAAGTRSQGHKNSGSRFKKGDRVVTHNKEQIPIHGTVRWTAEANTDGDKVNVIGIETVSDTVKVLYVVYISIVIMPRYACASEVYGSVFVCVSVCQSRLLQLLRDQQVRVSIYEAATLHMCSHTPQEVTLRPLVTFSWISIKNKASFSSYG